MKKSKPYNLLVKFLLFLIAFLLVGVPVIFSLLDGDLFGLTVGLGLLGLWLLLMGKLKLGKLSLEGKRAFSVGGALFLPLLISAAVNKLELWPPLVLGSTIVGFVTAVILYFVVKSTTVSKDRTLARIIFLGGIGATIIGFSINPPSDTSGVILVNGIPILPISSMAFFLLMLGVAGIVVGLYGLIFNYSQKK